MSEVNLNAATASGGLNPRLLPPTMASAHAAFAPSVVASRSFNFTASGGVRNQQRPSTATFCLPPPTSSHGAATRLHIRGRHPISGRTLLNFAIRSRKGLDSPSKFELSDSVRKLQHEKYIGDEYFVLVFFSANLKASVDLFPLLPQPGLSFRTTQENLRSAFEKFGQVTEVHLVMDRVAKRPRGFAFVSYTDEEEVKNIEGMHGKYLDGRVIFVEAAKRRPGL
ncbi:hypothetical protein HU200_032982 [Digitaria exilis]|uniref:RRM domain-containing protein n=1 Tax=Digitaria exilis TaxID=1010633 RepID=A0A835ELC2_9POAL|nr:hypothetical protein HU200_032982 [Digitaria exilis]